MENIIINEQKEQEEIDGYYIPHIDPVTDKLYDAILMAFERADKEIEYMEYAGEKFEEGEHPYERLKALFEWALKQIENY